MRNSKVIYTITFWEGMEVSIINCLDCLYKRVEAYTQDAYTNWKFLPQPCSNTTELGV